MVECESDTRVTAKGKCMWSFAPINLSVAFEPRPLFMEHDLVPRRTRLLKSNSYVASPGCKTSVTWYKQKAGHVLIDPESRTNAVLAVVGKVLESRLDCDGHGNFRKRVFQDGVEMLDKAKYQLLLGKPNDTPFADDFDVAIDTLSAMQANTAIGVDRQNLIIRERQEKSLRFTREIFEPRSQGDYGSFKNPNSKTC